MKRSSFSGLLAALLVVLSVASTARADKRAFRVNADSANGGYAIAWGFQGKKTDFEKLDRLNDDDLAQVLSSKGARLKNYLVQLETNTVVETFDGKGRTRSASRIDGRVGEQVFSADFGLSVVAAHAAGLPGDTKLLFVLQQNGRVTTVREMILVEESAQRPARILTSSRAFNQLFDKALAGFLSKADLARYRQTNGFELKLKPSFENPFEEIDFEVVASNSQDESVMNFGGKMRVTFTAGEPSLTLTP